MTEAVDPSGPAVAARPTERPRSRRWAQLIGVVLFAALVVGTVLGIKALWGSDDGSGDTVDVAGKPVAVIRQNPPKGAEDTECGVTVVFLHGAAYDKSVWVRTGAMATVAAEGFPAVAVDLPGYGDSPANTSVGKADWVRALLAKVAPKGAVLVSPSMSGEYSLAAIKAGVELKGFVPIAPVGVTDFSNTGGVSVRSMVVWGSEDDTFSPDMGEVLTTALGGRPKAELRILAGAGHAAYEDRPGEFNPDLASFVQGICTQG